VSDHATGRLKQGRASSSRSPSCVTMMPYLQAQIATSGLADRTGSPPGRCKSTTTQHKHYPALFNDGNPARQNAQALQQGAPHAAARHAKPPARPWTGAQACTHRLRRMGCHRECKEYAGCKRTSGTCLGAGRARAQAVGDRVDVQVPAPPGHHLRVPDEEARKQVPAHARRPPPLSLQQVHIWKPL